MYFHEVISQSLAVFNYPFIFDIKLFFSHSVTIKEIKLNNLLQIDVNKYIILWFKIIENSVKMIKQFN